jgi:hypothetical protein
MLKKARAAAAEDDGKKDKAAGDGITEVICQGVREQREG